MQGGSAEGWNWISQSAMDESSAKKARLQELPKSQQRPHEARSRRRRRRRRGGGGRLEGGGLGRVDRQARPRVLHCPRRSRPYSPRVFKCKGGHFACAACVAELPGGQCETCDENGGGGGFDPCPDLETVVSSATISCPHAGCGRFLVYRGEHRDAYAHAPCPAALAARATSRPPAHAVPMDAKVSRIQVSASVPRMLLVAENDGRVFLLTVRRRVGRVRAGQRGGAAKVHLQDVGQPGAVGTGGGERQEVGCRRNSTSPGAVVTVHEPTFLAVPPMYMAMGRRPWRWLSACASTRPPPFGFI